jgi:XTP/dITP diphosphohydrolase
MEAMSVVVATSNRGKLAELRGLLAGVPIEVLSLGDALGEARATIVEDGETFEDNALKKARSVAEATLLVTIADDSGLEVDVLGGQPGVRSARFAREGASDAENNAELLRRLTEIDDTERTARFRCVLALVDPWGGGEIVVEGRCEGRIAHKPSGAGGFGYDPLFVVEENGRTLAELDEADKNRVSHRGRALAALLPHLEALVAARLAEAAAVRG